ncbi:MAG: virulence protein [Selenomonadales bacterium]|nr:virulence protein [Selenomonadales bacterium]
MELKFNVTGEARKALVKAAGEALGWEPVYKGAPSFAYVVSNVTISRGGTLSWDERTDEAAIRNLLGRLREMGFVPAEEEIDTDTLTIEMPLVGFTDTALENLDRLIAGKAALIKKAIGADSLPVERTETTLKFPWFKFGIDGATVAAYSRFIGALCAAAKGQKRVTGREKAVENEKYAFRVFLLRLGFVGDDYKEARKILLKNLSGNSAFKSGAPAKTEVDADA